MIADSYPPEVFEKIESGEEVVMAAGNEDTGIEGFNSVTRWELSTAKPKTGLVSVTGGQL